METSNTPTYLTSLMQSGLSYGQARVYEVLLTNGPLKAGKIHEKSDLKRGLIYKVLEELITLGLVLKSEEPGKVAVFEPEHPAKLKDMAEKHEQKAKTAQLVLDGILGQLTSEFNLVSGAPGVQFFEGKEGIRKILADSLTSKTEIYSYADIEAINTYIKEINDDYVAKREKLQLKKKGIFLDSPQTRQLLTGYHASVTESKIIQQPAMPFETVMQIYDNKISYLTLSAKKIIGIIIADPFIYNMHKYLFEYTWKNAQNLPQAANSEGTSANPARSTPGILSNTQ